MNDKFRYVALTRREIMEIKVRKYGGLPIVKETKTDYWIPICGDYYGNDWLSEKPVIHKQALVIDKLALKNLIARFGENAGRFLRDSAGTPIDYSLIGQVVECNNDR